MTSSNKINNDSLRSQRSEWFTDLVSTLRVDEQKMNIGVMDENRQAFYDKMMFGDLEDLALSNIDLSAKAVIKSMLELYFAELKKRKSFPLKMALDLSNSKILVWAEIEKSNEIIENSLILSEAVVNAKYSPHGFHLYSTIVEDCDSLEIPEHYTKV